MHAMLTDLRFAARRLRKRPLFTAIAIVSLALGIGANTAIFSLVEALLLRPSAIVRPDEVVEVYPTSDQYGYQTFSYPDLEDFRAATEGLFTGYAASRFSFISRDVGGGVESVPIEIVSGEYFGTLGIAPHLGRLLGPEDDVAPGGHPVVVLAHDYWQRQFGGDPGVIGRTLRLSGGAYTVVGVASPAYRGLVRGVEPALYGSMSMLNQLSLADSDEFTNRDNHAIFLRARLAPGVELPRARAAAAAYAEEMKRLYPETAWIPSSRMQLTPLSEIYISPLFDHVVVAAALLLTVVVGLVLLVACANLASFLLAQARDRRREIAIRLALGANRRALLRQLLSESVVLALVGGVLGLGLAWLAVRSLLGADLPVPVPVDIDVRLNASVLAYTLGASIVAGILFGIAPALQATKPDVVDVIKGENTGGGAPGRISFRGTLVVAQVATCMVLLVLSGLLLRSLRAQQDVDPGFGDAPAALMVVGLPVGRYDAEGTRLLVRRMQERIAGLPGVRTVGVASHVPLDPTNNASSLVTVAGLEPPPGEHGFNVHTAAADTGFFAAAGIAIVRGRGFRPADDADAPPVALINGAMAERLWPGQEPIGRSFRADGADYQVVGITEDFKVRTLGEAPRMFFFRAHAQTRTAGGYFLARTRGDAAALLPRALAAIHEVEPDAIIVRATTMRDFLAVMTLPARLGALAVSAFAILALTLAVIGVYGVVSYAVARRTREVAIRLSIGADPAALVRMLTADGVRLVLAGAALGTLAALAGAGALRGLLFGVAPLDLLAFGTALAALLAIGALAAWLPARRASRVDPAKVLRTE